MSPRVTTQVSPPGLPSYRTTVEYSAITRYVYPATPEQILAGSDPFIDIGPSDLAPPWDQQHLPPIGMQSLPEGGRTVQQWAPPTMKSSLSVEGVSDWWYQLSFWLVAGGAHPDHPSPWPQNPCPTAEMLPTNVYSLAVYELDGGPIGEKATAWLVEAWDLSAEPYPVPLPYAPWFNVVSEPGLTDAANKGGPISTVTSSQDIQARRQVGWYHFSHWSVDGAPVNPKAQVVSQDFLASKNTSGRARAWYSIGEGIKPPPNTPDGGIGPGPDPGPSPISRLPAALRLQSQFDMASALAGIAVNLSPDLRSGALDLAFKQAKLATSSIKKSGSVGKKRTGNFRKGSVR